MKKIIYVFTFLILLGFGCTDSFEELNTDLKRPSAVSAEPLFSNAVVNLFDLMTDANVNRNVFRLYAQYWSQTTYPSESNYDLSGRDIPGTMWDILYRDVLRDLKEARTLLDIEKTPITQEDIVALSNKKAIIKILEAYAYTILVDLFGDVPYTEALSDDLTPKYDNAQMIYASVINNLQDAIADLDTSYGSFTEEQDPVYEGNTANWKKLGNSLLLRLGMRLADTDETTARLLVETALIGGLIESNSDDFAITYYSSAPNTNPLHATLVLSGRNDYVPANTTVDIMNALEDPRRALWFDKNGLSEYIGGIYGASVSFNTVSHFGGVFEEATSPGNLFSYSEIQFLLAEAAERAYEVGGTAEQYYNEGISASILEWGGSQAMADTYLAQTEVAYSTGSGDWRAKIGKQKWLSLFNNGMEGWTTWRLFDLDYFNVPSGLDIEDIPIRFIYPLDEATLNPSNYDNAAAKYGGDIVQARLFWDVN